MTDRLFSHQTPPLSRLDGIHKPSLEKPDSLRVCDPSIQITIDGRNSIPSLPNPVLPESEIVVEPGRAAFSITVNNLVINPRVVPIYRSLISYALYHVPVSWLFAPNPVPRHGTDPSDVRQPCDDLRVIMEGRGVNVTVLSY